MNRNYETEPYNDKEMVNFGILRVGQHKFIEYMYIIKFNSLWKLFDS